MGIGDFVHYDVPRWIEENKKDFVPPVCNKCMYSDQLKVFLVGGPNTRKDFHLEEGEEFFYQIKGDMCLPVVENGMIKDVAIKEGHVFMLPSRTLHSPQRFENTIGLVVERKRAPWELECLRYHVEGTTDILFERWVHLTDVVKDLPPIIKEYFASEAHKTGKPTQDSIVPNRPFDPNPAVRVEEPVLLKDWIQKNKQQIEDQKVLQLYGPPKYKTHVLVHGAGIHDIPSRYGDTFLYFIEGQAQVTADDGSIFHLSNCNTLRIPEQKGAQLTIQDGYALTVHMETPREKAIE